MLQSKKYYLTWEDFSANYITKGELLIIDFFDFCLKIIL